MSRNVRNLTADELALWQYVTRNVKRPKGRALTSAVSPPEVSSGAKVQPIPKPTAPSSSRQPGTTAPPSRALVLGASDGIDRRTAQRFSRGEMKIDARLDLHGMNLSQAEAAVTHFIRSAAAADYRCVLVVTGKGQRKSGSSSAASFSDENVSRGRIRSEAPHWLSRQGLRPLILAVREAHFRHGGGGALYVLLKRRRGARVD
ncbi:MAG: DNA mismatch repair protein MutS [Rhodospirillaceae bacterium]|nr:MAG: DNA mismatch repair protein MutS [Rhodospirillaceae bacterium]